jgi:putative inorganic carbon (hco3(-)) transporter
MRDLFFVAFLMAMLLLGLRRPFLLVLVYAYIDIVSPQRLAYYFLSVVPISLIAFSAAFLGWLATDNKSDMRFSFRQALIIILLAYCGYTTLHADFPKEALEKWSWVWKALVFAIFLPLTLRTRLRIEALALLMVLCASSIIITGGIKTALSGGGYGSLKLLVDNNSGLYEGSIISTVAIGLIPLILYFTKYGTIFPPNWRVKVFGYALCGACLLIPVGTQARTGLICLAVIAFLMWLHTRRRFLWASMAAVALIGAIPLLPAAFLERMGTIATFQSDESASTRVAVWKWTIDYVKENPVGGGFNNYLQNSFSYRTVKKTGEDNLQQLDYQSVTDRGRAFHSSYFEMLGEQGYFGLFLWLAINFGTVFQSMRLYRRFKGATDTETRWISPFSLAMLQGHISYLVGSLFVGIAYQPFVFMLIALQIGATTYARRRERARAVEPILPGYGLTG